jgi:hypothetical protein
MQYDYFVNIFTFIITKCCFTVNNLSIHCQSDLYEFSLTILLTLFVEQEPEALLSIFFKTKLYYQINVINPNNWKGVVVVNKHKVVDMNSKKSKSLKNVIKDAGTGTIQSIATFGTSIVDLIKKEGDLQKEQFNNSIIHAKDENERQAIRSHDLKKAAIRAGTALGCVGLIVYINKNS